MSDEPLQQVERQAAFWFAVLAVIAAALIFAFAVLVTTHLHNWEKVLEEHFAAIIGLPGAAAAAFVPRVIFLIAFCIRKVHCHALHEMKHVSSSRQFLEQLSTLHFFLQGMEPR